MNSILSASNSSSEGDSVDMASKLETLKLITADVKSTTALQSNNELLTKSVNLLINTLQSDMTRNMNNGSVLIERPKVAN